MRSKHLNLLCTVNLLTFMLVTVSNIDAANINNGQTITAPPQTDEAMTFVSPAPGGTFSIGAGYTFTGALTTTISTPGKTLVLDSGSVLNGAVGDLTNPLLQLNLTGDATIVGATSVLNYSLGQNTLNLTGAVNSPSGLVINTRVVSNHCLIVSLKRGLIPLLAHLLQSM